VNKVLAGAIAAGVLTSATFLASGAAAADDAVLIVPGTEAPDGPAKRFYHFKPEWTPEIAAKYYANPGVTPQVITYPRTNPTSTANSVTVGQSVATGANNLDAAIRSTNGPITVVGLSQGSEVITEEQLRLANDPSAPPPDQITFIKVSDPAIVLRRLFQPGTHLPIFNYTVPPPVDSQYNTVNVVSQYDFVGDPPGRWGNLLAVLNSGVGLNHTMVAFSDPASVPPQNIAVATNSRDATVTTYRVPVRELPLVTQLRQWGVPDPAADTMNAVMRPMVDRAYPPDPSPRPVLQPLVPLLNAVDHASTVAPAASIPVSSSTTATAANNAVSAAKGIATKLGLLRTQ
jgi:hypothetical protein